MSQHQATQNAEESNDNQFELGEEEERNLHLCIENFRNGSFLHRYLYSGPWLKWLCLAVVD